MKFLLTLVSIFAMAIAQAETPLCSAVVESTQQLIRSGHSQQIELRYLSQCPSSPEKITQSLVDETIAHCAGAFWCYVIPSKEACEDADSCHWVPSNINSI